MEQVHLYEAALDRYGSSEWTDSRESSFCVQQEEKHQRDDKKKKKRIKEDEE